MSNKNAFEIRSEILGLAADHLQQQFQTNLEFARNIADPMVAALQASFPKMPALENPDAMKDWADAVQAQMKSQMDKMAKMMPQYPTSEEILKKAKELYTFVDLGK